ncbi:MULTISPECIES: GGDEF domain-containing protein [Shewanella]|uniref:GGDEF domain-containing protein n=1 Tax=Shewanella TaxID=22 RepID=UPI001CC4620B|nr:MULTISPECIES: GGDEF domain-containing protein [Shewanella]MDN5501041.1 GGDEF domain-containing protein [Shewanella sp.]MDN5528817.1 GGDEF domain-containing protein [Shewanella sp.]BDA60406.1 GGDEF domain-containing protein [Shewanella xiamenensis]
MTLIKSDQNQAFDAIHTILNSLDALVYVSDLHSYELLYLNDYGTAIWGKPAGKKCYQLLQAGQNSPCAFCTNHKLIGPEGNATGVHVWEFQNTQNKRWYQCRDQAIRWTDGRLVRIEIATDITERKHMEQALIEAKFIAERLANTNELTKLFNRRAFFHFGRPIAHQSGQALAFIMFDIDHFKRVNDQWGHATGDAALIHIAQLTQTKLRTNDILARLGGEEFGLILPNTQHEQAWQIAESIRHGFDTQPLYLDGHTIHCTASFGISSLILPQINHPDEAQALLETLFNNADQAMMRAKRTGRNRVCDAE